jgi:predicted TPR repeat methyltransferase
MQLYNKDADPFDDALVGHLQYRTSDVLLRTLKSIAANRGIEAKRKRCGDLGCGTGLSEAAFRGAVDWLAMLAGWC